MKVIPAIDLLAGRCVRLLRGDFGKKTVYSDDPAGVARNYEATGFDCLHVVDLDGARHGRQHNEAAIRRLVDGNRLAVQLGGGLRDDAQLDYWLDSGVCRVVIGSLAVTDVRRVRGWLSRYGADKIVLALDVEAPDGAPPRLLTHGWTRPTAATLWECIENYRDAGLRHVLCTDIARDGALAGPNLDLYAELIERYAEIELQASGGVRNVDDLRALDNLGVPAVITGRALLDGRISTTELQSFLPAA